MKTAAPKTLPNIATAELKAEGGTVSRPLSSFVAQGRVDIRDFGAKGDDTTDDTAAIQNAIDYALENGIAKVYGPPGFVCKTTKTIHIGYGVPAQQFSTVVLEGDQATYVDQSCAFTIKAYFKDRPIINIQGGRNSGVRRIRIEGTTTINNPQTQTLAWRANAANYVPSGAVDNATAPFCGVCVDGYSGAAPGTPYPTPTYPAFLGSPTGAYNRSYSSGYMIEDCVIQYTLIGICVHPNSDGNGDFGVFRGSVISYEKVAISFGNSQARCNDFRLLNIYGIHTVFDGLQYTAGANGVLSGSYDGVHLNTYYRMFNIAMNWSYPFVVQNVYSEVGMRIGDFTAPGKIKFIGCLFDNADTNRFIANSEIWCEPIVTNGGGITFEDCDLIYHRAAAYFQGAGIRFINCSFRVAGWEAALSGTELIALKTMGGLLIDINPAQPTHPVVDSCGTILDVGYVFCGYDVTTLNTWHSKGSIDYTINEYDVANMSRIHASAIGSPSFSGRGFSCNPGAGQYFKPGDLFYAVGNGAENWFFVTAYNSGTGAMTLQAMCFYKWNGTTYTMLKTTTPTSWYYFPCGAMHPPVDVNKFMVTTVGSAVVNVVDGNGTASARPTAITTDSKPFWMQSSVNRLASVTPFSEVATVASVATNSFTMSQNAIVAGTWLMAPGIKRLK